MWSKKYLRERDVARVIFDKERGAFKKITLEEDCTAGLRGGRDSGHDFYKIRGLFFCKFAGHQPNLDHPSRDATAEICCRRGSMMSLLESSKIPIRISDVYYNF